MKNIFSIIALMVCISARGANWFVSSTVGTSGNGQSWATAWKNSGNIVWGSISAGDTIWFDGGSSGLSYSSFNQTGANGTAGNYITIARSTETGRDGIVTFATPIGISGNYIKFDGGGYKQVSGTTYRCGIVFTCSSVTITAGGGSFTGGQSVNCGGSLPWFKYCYFNGTYTAGQGNSFGVRNANGFILERCWFYQASWEDQISFQATTTGGKMAITNCVFQDNNKPNRTDDDHRDIINTWTGSGGYSIYLVNSILFNTLNRPGVSGWQGDGFLMQIGFGGSGPQPITECVAINNVCYNHQRFIAFGSLNTGVSSGKMYHNTVRVINNEYGPLGNSGWSYTSINNNGTDRGSTFTFVNAGNPLGADGIPFTADDGYNLPAGSAAINAGSGATVPTDILGHTRTNAHDLGAYEYGAGDTPVPTVPIIDLSLSEKDFGIVRAGVTTNISFMVSNKIPASGAMVGTVSVSSPYSVVSGGSYTLHNGSNHPVTLQYAPTVQDLDETQAVLTGGQGAVFSLTGRAITNQVGLTWFFTNSLFETPWTASGNMLNQTSSSDTAPPDDGSILFGFSLTTNGYYYWEAAVRATNGSSDSIYYAIDADPSSIQDTWDVLPVTVGTQSRVVGRRGTGTFDNPQWDTNIVYLLAGDHYLRARYREANAGLSNLTLRAYSTNVGAPPKIIIQPPAIIRLTAGMATNFGVTVTGTDPITRVYTNGVFNGVTSTTNIIASAAAINARTYSFIASNAFGMITSSFCAVKFITTPTFTVEITDVTLSLGQDYTFEPEVTGEIATYVWSLNGLPMFYQDTAPLSITGNPNTVGVWTLEAFNEAGDATSDEATVTLADGLMNLTTDLNVGGDIIMTGP